MSAIRMSAVVLAFAVLAGACGRNSTPPPAEPQRQAQEAAQNKAQTATIYVDKNHVELDNYNRRQALADDPAAIIWCTSSFPQPSSPMFTVPVVGKLTSGQKRPYPTTKTTIQSGGGNYSADRYTYQPELPGPDGMYGASGDYRYGFTPAGFYVDFFNIATFCTTELTVFQRENTTVMLSQDNSVAKAQDAAQAILRALPANATDAQRADANARATQVLLTALVKK